MRLITYFIILITACLTVAPLIQSGLGQDVLIIIQTDKDTYVYRDTVNISGRLYFQSNEAGGLVAIQVNEPVSGKILFVRTAIVDNPLPNWGIEILYVKPCDLAGNPKSEFIKGPSAYAYFETRVKSNFLSSRPITIVISMFDHDFTPLGVKIISGTIEPNGIFGGLVAIPIPEWCSLGNSTVYVSALSGLPSEGGYPYCPDGNASFLIAESSSHPSTAPSKLQNQSYLLSFTIPPYDTPYSETFPVFASAYCNGESETTSISFNVNYIYPEDIDNDHIISILDICQVASKYGSTGFDLNWDPKCDIIPDGKINILDMSKLCGMYNLKY